MTNSTTGSAIAFPETLRAITVHAPHAYAIVQGIKAQEYRRRTTNLRGWILIHCGLSEDSDRFFKNYGISSDVPRGGIVGAAKITACNKVGLDFEYVLENPIKFPKLLKISGKQAIFWKPANQYEERVFSQAWSLIPKN